MTPIEKQLRLWPGVVAAVLLLVVWFGVPLVAPDPIISFLGALACGVVILVWWAFFSRAPHLERWGALLMMIAGTVAVRPLLDASISTAAQSRLFFILSIPVLTVALVVWAVASRRLAQGPRRVALVAILLLACGGWTTLRTEGITGGGSPQLAWRWTKTPEQKLLARVAVEPLAKPSVVPVAVPVAAAVPVTTPVMEKTAEAKPRAEVTLGAPVRATARIDWPGFRGAHRDDVVTGVRIKTDWATSPPVELWRRPVGPGWSSFAVGNGLVYTQEQRGEKEVVACYQAATGAPVWTHGDAARFWESNGGAGPRGTPTLYNGRVYSLGATGIVNALDAANGAVIWTRNAATDTGAALPGWGFSSSPLVVDDLVIVAASGRLAGYEIATGNPRWKVTTGGGSYSSPQLLTIGGVPQVVMMNGSGATSVAPVDGKVLWKHAWPGSPMLQPSMTADGAVLITTGEMAGNGTRRLSVAQGPGGWTAEEVWTSTGLKPYFNDIVVHEGHAFGFDGGILACIDLKDGKRTWKGGRYGHGQLLLLADQHLLLVLSEEGDLALAGAVPGQFSEMARIPAMHDKTWNHLVVVGDLLLVRNSQEMVAFRLPLAGS